VGMGIGGPAQSPIPKPQSPIPNPQIVYIKINKFKIKYNIILFNFIIFQKIFNI